MSGSRAAVLLLLLSTAAGAQSDPAAKALEKADSYAKQISRASTLRSLDKVFEKALELHDEAGLEEETRDKVRQKIAEALRENQADRIKKLGQRTKHARGLVNLAKLKLELNRRREAAVKVIYDEAAYLREDHPDWGKGDKKNGQAEVDRLVGEVRQIWEQPLSAATPESLKTEIEMIRAINDKYLDALGEEPTEGVLKEYEHILNNLNEAALVGIRSYCLDGNEKKDYQWNRRVEKYNADLRDPDVSEDVKKHVKIVNDYREMMGRKRCFIDARLCRAALKHSQVCDKAGRIWHNGADGTPKSRAEAEGFKDGVAENVCSGYSSPEDTWWKGWYRASDHHRNALRERWNCAAYGYAGKTGTQNFSETSAPKGL